MVVWVLASSCTHPDSAPSPDAGEVQVATGSQSEQKTPEGLLFPSRRCGECHGRQRTEWMGSAHAHAADGEAYSQAIAKLGEGESARCEGCHVPLSEAGPRIARDGVGCDACHTAVATAQAPRVLTLAPERATRFGPFKDAKDHNFHRVAFSSFVTEAGLCEACHQDPPGRKVAEYTTVAEWSKVEDHLDCVTCHMPGFRAVAAKGAKMRNVSHHDFGRDKVKALGDALSLAVKVEGSEATVTLTNASAQHDLPTGRPERRMKLQLDWLDAAGATVASQTEVFGRFLVDGRGEATPSFLAERELRDTRLKAGEDWVHAYPRASGARSVRARLYYQRFDPALSQWFGSSDDVLVLERKEAL